MGKYFGLGDDWDELTAGYTSGGTKALAGLKILGKVVANVGTFAVTEVVPGMIETAGKHTEKALADKRSEMTPEQIEKAERVIQNGKDIAQRRNEAHDIEWTIQQKTDQMQSYANDDPRRFEIQQEIRELEATKPTWYGSK